MGILRLWLASVVLLGHAPAIPGIGRYFHAMIAVQIFFAISGFFMQFILPPNDPNWRQTLNFYGSRACAFTRCSSLRW
jgi:peptidoglycan/LPS O-acetylase OafA/YrhL